VSDKRGIKIYLILSLFAERKNFIFSILEIIFAGAKKGRDSLSLMKFQFKPKLAVRKELVSGMVVGMLNA
jgi:hypothetical protein